jgi:thiosulfate oxidation carrier complex protein SoxZ
MQLTRRESLAIGASAIAALGLSGLPRSHPRPMTHQRIHRRRDPRRGRPHADRARDRRERQHRADRGPRPAPWPSCCWPTATRRPPVATSSSARWPGSQRPRPGSALPARRTWSRSPRWPTAPSRWRSRKSKSPSAAAAAEREIKERDDGIWCKTPRQGPQVGIGRRSVTIKTLISHKMESGQRKDGDGNLIPRSIINRFTCDFNGENVIDVTLEPAISTNPYFQFDATSRKRASSSSPGMTMTARSTREEDLGRLNSAVDRCTVV